MSGGILNTLILPIAQVKWGESEFAISERYSIPGVGQKTGSYCGQASKLVVCSKDHDHHKLIKHACHKWSCPECLGYNVHRASERASERIKSARPAYALEGLDIGRVHHIVFSPSKSEYSLPIDELKRTAIKHASRVGVLGGGIVVHQYRIKQPYDYELGQVLKALPKEQRHGKWDLIRKDILSLGSWEAYTEYEPHFHIVGYMPAVKEKSNDFYDRTGWTYKNISLASGKPLKSVKGTVAYLLTHAAYIPGKQIISYFGVCSYNKLEVKIIKRKVDSVCKECGGLMWVHVFWELDEDNKILNIGEQAQVHETVERQISYKVRHKSRKK